MLLPVVRIDSTQIAKGKKVLSCFSKPLSRELRRSFGNTNHVTLNTTEQRKALIFHPGNCTLSSEQKHHLETGAFKFQGDKDPKRNMVWQSLFFLHAGVVFLYPSLPNVP